MTKAISFEERCKQCGNKLWYKPSLKKQICTNRKCKSCFYNSKTTFELPENALEKLEALKAEKLEALKAKAETAKNSPESTSESTSDKKHVPTVNGYIPRKLFGTTDIKILEGLYSIRTPVLIMGETGCGKTHAVRNFCYEKKLPYKRLSLNGGTTSEDLIGQFTPTGEGQFKWQDGWLTKFARNGGVIVLDEVNGCSAEILFALHSITDDERVLTLSQKDGETIKAHPDLWIVATMNYDYEGTKELNQAFRDRFRIVPWDYDTNVEKKLGIPEKMLEITKQLRELFKTNELSYPVSTRTLLQYKEDCEIMGENVAQELFLQKFQVEEERKAVAEIIKLNRGKNIEVGSTVKSTTYGFIGKVAEIDEDLCLVDFGKEVKTTTIRTHDASGRLKGKTGYWLKKADLEVVK